MAWQKSAKKSYDKQRLIPLCSVTGNVKVVTLRKNLATNNKLNLTIDNQKWKSPKKDIASGKYINISNWIYTNYKCKINPKYYRHNHSIFAKKWFSLYNFGHLSKNRFVKNI